MRKNTSVPSGAFLSAWFIEGRSRCFRPLLWVTRCVYSSAVILDPLIGIVAGHKEHGLQEDFAGREPIGDATGGLQKIKIIIFPLKLFTQYI